MTPLCSPSSSLTPRPALQLALVDMAEASQIFDAINGRAGVKLKERLQLALQGLRWYFTGSWQTIAKGCRGPTLAGVRGGVGRGGSLWVSPPKRCATLALDGTAADVGRIEKGV